MSKLLFIVLTCLTVNCLAVDCVLTVESLREGTLSSCVMLGEGSVVVDGFSASFAVDTDRGLEQLSITSPAGSSVTTEYPLGGAAQMSARFNVENLMIASLVCVR